MSKPAPGNGEAKERIARTEKFSDGSELIELEGGTLLIRESKHAKAGIVAAERPVNYNEPAPAPRSDRSA